MSLHLPYFNLVVCDFARLHFETECKLFIQHLPQTMCTVSIQANIMFVSGSGVAIENQRCLQNSVKHQRWSLLRKELTA